MSTKKINKDTKQNDNNDEVVEAIRDLTRIFLALHGEFASKSEIIRQLYDLSIPPARIARLLGMQGKDVTSAIYKMKKSIKKVGKASSQNATPDNSIIDNQTESVQP